MVNVKYASTLINRAMTETARENWTSSYHELTHSSLGSRNSAGFKCHKEHLPWPQEVTHVKRESHDALGLLGKPFCMGS